MIAWLLGFRIVAREYTIMEGCDRANPSSFDRKQKKEEDRLARVLASLLRHASGDLKTSHLALPLKVTPHHVVPSWRSAVYETGNRLGDRKP